MTPEEFKARWDSDEDGGGITYADIAACAIAWGVSPHPMTDKIGKTTALVLERAGCSFPDDEKIL